MPPGAQGPAGDRQPTGRQPAGNWQATGLGVQRKRDPHDRQGEIHTDGKLRRRAGRARLQESLIIAPRADSGGESVTGGSPNLGGDPSKGFRSVPESVTERSGGRLG